MSKVHQIFDLAVPKIDYKESDELVHNSGLGIELELEGAYPMLNLLKEEDTPNWDAKRDGSLRHEGIEFVFKRPLCGVPAATAIKNIGKLCNETNPTSSVNCSTHVHMDFSDKTENDVFKFLFTYLIFEDALARYCGPNRQDNLFCLTASNAEAQTGVLRSIYRSGDYQLRLLGGINEERLKYAAMNLGSLRRFGTLESRLAPALTDADKMFTWVNILLSIRKYSESLASPVELLQALSVDGHIQFCRRVFGDYSHIIEPVLIEDEVVEAIDRIQYIIS